MADEYRRYDTGYTGAQVVELLGRVPRVTELVESVDGRVTVMAGRLAELENGGGGDKHLEMNFYNEVKRVFSHNLGKKPAVTVVDGSGDVILADVRHVNDNAVLVSFGMSVTGRVIFN